MQIDYQVKGPERKEMAQTIANVTNEELTYSGVPKCEYQVGPYTVTKEGMLVWDETNTNGDDVVAALAEKGWTANADDKLSISMPRNILDDRALDRLKSLIEAKGTLMKHAFKTEDLSIEVDDEKITFSWFTIGDNPDRSNAYMLFIQALCKMAAEQARVTAKDKEVENEKYAFRCFLLRLGFIGKEYKVCRKVLMENLTGSAAFKSGKKKEEPSDELFE